MTKEEIIRGLAYTAGRLENIEGQKAVNIRNAIEYLRAEDWKERLIAKIEMSGDLDEKGAGGVYDLALDIAEICYNLIKRDNQEAGDLNYPDAEMACEIYDLLKYGA